MLAACIGIIATTVTAAPWEPEEYPIGYWHGPPASANTLETWQRVKDCNFTWAGARGGYSVEENLRRLDLCEEVGLPAMVLDGRIAWDMVANEEYGQRLAEVVRDYSQHPALYGYFIKDEPSSQLFEPLGMISQELERLDPAHLPYINLFPTYANTTQLGAPTYGEHLEQYLSTVKPRVLSYDHYALLKDGTDRADYFENLELIREYGLRHSTPQWNIILSISHLSYRDPTEGEMRWQVYTSLAYGIKGIMYFTYWTVESWAERGEVAIVQPNGEPARLYPIVRDLNAEIKALGKTLLGLTSTGVFHTGEIPQGCRRLGGDSAIWLPDDVPLLVGMLTDAEGGEYVMVANRNHAESVGAEASFLAHVKSVSVVSAETGLPEEQVLEDRTLTLRLEAGGGVLLKLETEFDYPEPPRPVQEIAFEFDKPGDLAGWRAGNAVGAAVVRDGAMAISITGHDPYCVRTFMGVPPGTVSKLKLRMRVWNSQAKGQLFWTTAAEAAFADDKHITFDIIPDGEWHEYELPVGEHPKWKGQKIQALRLDPTTSGEGEGARAEVDWIRGE